MNEVMTYVLSTGIGYVGVDALIYALALLLPRGCRTTLRLGRCQARVVLSLVAIQSALLLTSAVYVAARWPVLAVFPALGACWVGADAPALLAAARGGGCQRESDSSPVLVFGGVALLVGLATTFATLVRSR